jgi:hypothetical protein
MTTEVKPFGELTENEQVELFRAWLRGATIEYLICGEWKSSDAPAWSACNRYRIALTKPSIDWSHVAPEFKCLAQDADGYAYLFAGEPRIDGKQWLGGCEIVSAKSFTSYKPGTCDWRDSLVRRPEGE